MQCGPRGGERWEQLPPATILPRPAAAPITLAPDANASVDDARFSAVTRIGAAAVELDGSAAIDFADAGATSLSGELRLRPGMGSCSPSSSDSRPTVFGDPRALFGGSIGRRLRNVRIASPRDTSFPRAAAPSMNLTSFSADSMFFERTSTSDDSSVFAPPRRSVSSASSDNHFGASLAAAALDVESARLDRAAGDLASELKRMGSAVGRSHREWQRRERAASSSINAALVSKEQTYALRAAVRRKKEEAQALSQQIAADARDFQVEEARCRAEMAESETRMQQEMAKASSELGDLKEKLEQRRGKLEEQVATAKEASNAMGGTSVAGAHVVPPEALRARTIAQAVGESANSALSVTLRPDGHALHFARLLSEAAHAMAEALAASQPAKQRLPTSLQVQKAGGQSHLEAEAAVMADTLVGLAHTAQAGCSSAARRAELERLLFHENAKARKLELQSKLLEAEHAQLLEQYIGARQRRRELEAEQAEFVPFAAKELEDAVGRVARIRKAPTAVRKLAATAGHRLQERRRALSAGAKRASSCSDCGRK